MAQAMDARDLFIIYMIAGEVMVFLALAFPGPPPTVGGTVLAVFLWPLILASVIIKKRRERDSR